MKLIGTLCSFLFIAALTLLTAPAVASQSTEKKATGSSIAAADGKIVNLVKDTADQEKPKDKPKKSKKNDDKDGDPDDGNAGGGNDNRTTPNDGAAND